MEQTASHIVLNHAPAIRELPEVGDRFVHCGDEIRAQSRALAFIIVCGFGKLPLRFRVQDNPHRAGFSEARTTSMSLDGS